MSRNLKYANLKITIIGGTETDRRTPICARYGGLECIRVYNQRKDEVTVFLRLNLDVKFTITVIVTNISNNKNKIEFNIQRLYSNVELGSEYTVIIAFECIFMISFISERYV
jgi:glycogen debranching enzyme